ncbi:MAG: iron-containing alcohol dehydrogenase [Planctomycetaceae bacterium]|jgi:alcohol dehydrogenase class IV|nr:iron-containing alcohol dehydrogenase [Planctomycetaceae bacterium]
MITGNINSYNLLFPHKIVFGAGSRRELGVLAKPLGDRAILIIGSRTLEKLGIIRQLIANLETSGISILSTETISHEPETIDVDRLVGRLRNSLLPRDFVLTIGGGAALDLGKATAALLPQTQNASVQDYLEGVGRGLKLEAAPLPLIAVPTTAGTGAEATKNAVISSYQPPFKKSLRDDRMMPRLALIDPELSLHCPAKVTAESGMDAVTQLFESYVSRRRQPVTDALVEQGLPLAFEALPKLARQPDDLDSRNKIAHAALLSGIALANAGLGMAHGIAPALGVHCRIPHGAACALMLPSTLRTNAGTCSERYARLARLLLRIDSAISDDIATEKLIRKVEELCDLLGVPRRLSDLGIDSSMIPVLAKDSKGTSMSGNPKELSTEEITAILRNIA